MYQMMAMDLVQDLIQELIQDLVQDLVLALQFFMFLYLLDPDLHLLFDMFLQALVRKNLRTTKLK